MSITHMGGGDNRRVIHERIAKTGSDSEETNLNTKHQRQDSPRQWINYWGPLNVVAKESP
ncbi:hypothetical protein SAMN02745225_02376 [Ferrithrix thermotolerans DSM 19514]|uniref:Uncharacterized protein n=1 Tax=Ferrithrix thermotolerans DSM 19514 TaxID=1121881 RepID=A0A1M4YN87_9ACTN|nr:hypothetical protein SAMN02745225_02376 [Ferrithrix thermotolerans DSM 19514]